MDFEYFYNREAERFNFLKVPEILVDREEFRGLSAEAIILYSILLKRTGMSFKNNWIDKEGRVFIYFTVEEIMKRRNISKVKDFNLRSKENELQEVKNLDSNYIENNKSKYSKREYSFGENGLGTFQNVFLAAEDISDLQIIMNSQLENYIRLPAKLES